MTQAWRYMLLIKSVNAVTQTRRPALFRPASPDWLRPLQNTAMPRSRASRTTPLITMAALIRLGLLALVLAIASFIAWLLMIWMPGTSFQGDLPALTTEQALLSQALRTDVEAIATLGPRNANQPETLEATAQLIEQRFTATGLIPQRQAYEVEGQRFSNIAVEIPGTERPDQIVLIGAHYDTAYSSPGANDNGTGVAAVLQLAEAFADQKPARTLRFVAFTNEEPPFFWTENMGSVVYANQAKANGDDIIAMLSLETLGYYSDQPGSQDYPKPLNWFYPSTGNFVAFVGDLSARKLVRTSVYDFRKQAQFPAEGASLPNALPGVGWSDHWAFSQAGYEAIMVTDTATFRDPTYHTLDDKPENLDFERFARVTTGLQRVISDFVGLS